MAVIFKLEFPFSTPGNVELGSTGVALPVAGRAARAFAVVRAVPVPVRAVESAAGPMNVLELMPVPEGDEVARASEMEAEAEAAVVLLVPVGAVGPASVTFAVTEAEAVAWR